MILVQFSIWEDIPEKIIIFNFVLLAIFVKAVNECM